jgi:hypothetical protein
VKIETAADACAALAVLIAGADGRGTLAESAFLYDHVARMSQFGDLDRDGFTRLVSDAADWMWTSLPTEDDRLTDDAVGTVLQEICGAISPNLRSAALQMAVGLARADGVSPEERSLVERLCEGLGLDAHAADTLMG